MAKIRREAPPKHVVVVDTSILWHADRAYPVSPQFDRFLDDHAPEFGLELLVPEVVRGELLYQHVQAAFTSLERLNGQYHNLRTATGKAYSHRITESRLRLDIESRFEKWMAKRGAALVPTPVATIKWGEVIEAAVWRRPPFADAKDTPDGEKGFRDAMILESVGAAYASKDPASMFAFLTNDGALRDCADRRLGSADDWTSHDSLEAFAGHLDLTKEKHTTKFVKNIQTRASEKFFTSGASCLYTDERIADRIRSSFANRFATTDPNPTPFIGGLLGAPDTWRSLADEGRWISAARFQRLEGQREFRWKTVVSFVQLFRSSGSLRLFVSERLRILRFGVAWCANVRADGRFFDLKVIDIQEEEHDFREPTAEDRRRYRLRSSDEPPEVA